jgi:hypothetical protein
VAEGGRSALIEPPFCLARRLQCTKDGTEQRRRRGWNREEATPEVCVKEVLRCYPLGDIAGR